LLLQARSAETGVQVDEPPSWATALPHLPGTPPPPQLVPAAQRVLGFASQSMTPLQPSPVMPHVAAQATVAVIGTHAVELTHLLLSAPVPQIWPSWQPPASCVQSSVPPQPSPMTPHERPLCWQVVGTQVGSATQTFGSRCPA
jgi:hypothetical protein